MGSKLVHFENPCVSNPYNQVMHPKIHGFHETILHNFMHCVGPMYPTLMGSLLEDFRFVDICFVIIPILPEKKPNMSQGPRKELLVVSAAFYLFAFFLFQTPCMQILKILPVSI